MKVFDRLTVGLLDGPRGKHGNERALRTILSALAERRRGVGGRPTSCWMITGWLDNRGRREIARGTGLVEAGTDEPSAAGIRAIAEAVRSYGPERLYEVSALLPALGRRFRLEAADVAIIETLSSLEAIARAPYCRLKTTTEFCPQARSEDGAAAPIYLSSRSDHWAVVR